MTARPSDEVRRRLQNQTTQLWAAPGVVDLGIGQPQDAILPVDVLSAAMARAATRGRRHPLQYGIERGDGYLRAALNAFLEQQYGPPDGPGRPPDCAVDPDLMFVTNGNSQALDLCCATFAAPGDVVLVEEPTYFLALDIFRNHGLTVVPVPMDDEGLRADALEEAIARHRPALLYTIPSAHNPTGISMSEPRRRAVVDLARTHGVIVLADEVYHLLRYDGRPAQPMAAHLDSGVVICLNTFSKILAPGLRLGWIQAAEPLVARLEGRGYLVSGGGLNPFTASLVADVLEDGSAAAYLAGLRTTFAERIAVMDRAVQRHLPGMTWTTPTAGYFFWLRSEIADTADLRPPARALGAGFQPGRAFSATGGLRSYLRLSFAYYGSEDIEKAVEILGRVFGEEGRATTAGTSTTVTGPAPSST